MHHFAEEPGFRLTFVYDAPTSSADAPPHGKAEELGSRASRPDGTANTAAPTPRSFQRRRRNRHGRGLRGPLLMSGLPGARTRAERFEDLVVDSAARLRDLWGTSLEQVEYLVEEVPNGLEAIIASGIQAPLGKCTPAIRASNGTQEKPAVITIYRHPVEALCDAPWQVREVVHEVIIEQVAGLLNIDPDTVDPLFRRFRHGR